jgi:hypothetical protein
LWPISTGPVPLEYVEERVYIASGSGEAVFIRSSSSSSVQASISEGCLDISNLGYNDAEERHTSVEVLSK